MNYRHEYHAGNFADVFKHIILSMLLEALKIKDTPFTYLDTHAGRGVYQLHSVEAQKLKEYQSGVARLLEYAKTTPAPSFFNPYFDLIKTMNFEDALDVYPGSPKLAEVLLREQDHMILCELHPEEHQHLKEHIYRDAGLNMHCMDAYHSMKAFLPPKTARGLVHIDPPFEKTNELESIASALKLALKRWRMGHFMIWYPIKDKVSINRFHQTIKELNTSHLFVDFFMNNTGISSNLMGCGVALINPPWKLREQLSEIVLPYLATALQASWKISE